MWMGRDVYLGHDRSDLLKGGCGSGIEDSLTDSCYIGWNTVYTVGVDTSQVGLHEAVCYYFGVMRRDPIAFKNTWVRSCQLDVMIYLGVIDRWYLAQSHALYHLSHIILGILKIGLATVPWHLMFVMGNRNLIMVLINKRFKIAIKYEKV